MPRKPPRISTARMQRIYVALIDGADLARVQSIVEAFPKDMSVADCLILAAQIAGSALGSQPEQQRLDMLQGLYVAINDVVDQHDASIKKSGV